MSFDNNNNENSSFQKVEQHPQSALFHQPTNSRKNGILSLLVARQEYGNLSHCKAKFRNSRVTPTTLSSSIAWNVPRMQNMILAVGPATPATNTNINTNRTRSDTNNTEDDEDEDQNNDDILSASSSSSSAASEPQSSSGSTMNEPSQSRRDEVYEMSVEEAKDEEDDEEEQDEEEEDEDEDDDSGAQAHQRTRSGVGSSGSSGPRLSQHAEWFLRAVSNRDAEAQENEYHDAGDSNDDDDDDIEQEEEASSASPHRRRIRDNSSDEEEEEEESTPLEIAQRAILEWMDADDGDDDEDNGDDDDSDDAAVLAEANAIRRTRIRSERHHPRNNIVHEAAPSMRHGGCINTAAWLDCPWQLSLCGHSSSDDGYPSPSSIGSNNTAFHFGSAGDDSSSSLLKASSAHNCPTQLITSGDDRLIKFWDVRYAMGSSNVFPGGIDTVCPFSAPTVASPEGTVKEWKRYQKHCKNPPPGSVLPLISLPTGHRANVFHVTPVAHHPGKVASCGADGYLRLSDLQSTSTASIVVSPEYQDELSGILPAGLLSLRPGMCFSHHFLNANIGLLCSERGLRRFDLRLGPREQRSQSILGGPYRTCKACAVWSSSSTMDDDVESAYIFAGGSSGDVALYDLRMVDGSESKVVQHYRPRGLGPNASVSVSGLDVSRDKRELLVSYENDQIYSFPIFPNAKSAAGPTVDELTACCQEIDSDEAGSSVLTELASYGGHLNRFTFLKNAKYAGPQDEYICTGSDSGHAWIYERATGAVVSLLNADHSTCNGVVPHPTLPLFVTYGIDSTAKLWRATTPVDLDVDDSPLGRARCSNMQNYEKSPVVQSWKNVQTTLLSVSDSGDSEDEDYNILPDQVPTRDEELERSIFESLGSIFFRRRRNGPHGPGGPCIGNNLQNLPEVLRQNLFACVRAGQTGDPEPVRSGLTELKRRMSLIRLQHQAESHGLLWNSSIPWIMRSRDYYLGKSTYYRESKSSAHKEEKNCASLKKDVQSAVEYGHPVDLIPNKPSDWIPFDPEMTSQPNPCGIQFNTEEYREFCEERFGDLQLFWKKKCLEQQVGWKPPRTLEKIEVDGPKKGGKSICEESPKSKNNSNDMQTGDMKDDSEPNHRLSSDETTPVSSKSGGSGGDNTVAAEDTSMSDSAKYSWQLLHDTVLLLKESGNAAMQEGAVTVAAYRYDKAIQYCATAFTSYPNSKIEFVKSQQDSIIHHDGHVTQWVPLLKVLINTRLNLAMAMLKPQLSDPQGAAEQSSQALHELRPFVIEQGKVMIGRKRDQVVRAAEPVETFREAKTLQAKAYFRLGTAQYASQDFASAVKSFEHSIKSTTAASENGKPGTLVLRRLAEAKREYAKKKRRHRKKFKSMLGEDEEEQEEEEEEEEETAAHRTTTTNAAESKTPEAAAKSGGD